jgi:hypothetical protein
MGLRQSTILVVPPVFPLPFSFYLPIYIYLALLVRDDGQASLEHDVIIFFVN